MDKERRTGGKPTAQQLEGMLNDLQLVALRNIEKFGWELRFVRKASSQEAVPVVVNGEGNTLGVLEEDGRLNLQPDIQVRQSSTAEGASEPCTRISAK